MKEKSIIFDFFGVLFYLRIQPILKHIGIGKLLLYTILHGKTPFKLFFSILDKMRREVPGEFQELVTYGGYYLPKSICNWQRGELTSKEMLDRLTQYAEQLYKSGYFKSNQEKQMIINAIQSAFDPKQLITACKLNESVANAVYTLKKKQYRLYVLSNVDKELYKQLEHNYKNFFSIFDGIVTSCETTFLKPEAKIYLYLVDRYNLLPSNCCFIDDQKENIQVAQQIGMKGILYKRGENIVRKVQNIW